MMDGFVPWPDELAERYRRAGYCTGESLGHILRASAERFGERIALVDARRSWTESLIRSRQCLPCVLLLVLIRMTAAG